MLRQRLTSHFLSHQRGAKGSKLSNKPHSLLRRNIAVLLMLSLLAMAWPPLPTRALARAATVWVGSSASNRVIFKLRSAAPARLQADQAYVGQAATLGRISSKLGAVAVPLFRAERGRVALKQQIGLDRIFIVTLPPQVSGVGRHGERVPFAPVERYDDLHEALDARTALQFAMILFHEPPPPLVGRFRSWVC